MIEIAPMHSGRPLPIVKAGTDPLERKYRHGNDIMQNEIRTPLEPLSDREKEVLSLIAEGFSNRDTANHLFLSKRTVDFQLANIYSKLRVNNRMQAVYVAHRGAVIPISDPLRFADRVENADAPHDLSSLVVEGNDSKEHILELP